MKTLTTTLSIFALLLSNVAFCNNSNGDITPPLMPQRPGIIYNDITPPLMPQRPGIVNNDITPPLMPQRPGLNF